LVFKQINVRQVKTKAMIQVSVLFKGI